jgi:hypothetical protein
MISRLSLKNGETRLLVAVAARIRLIDRAKRYLADANIGLEQDFARTR